MVSITPFTAPAASRGETIRFGSLEFPAIPRDGSWAPPPFSPSQTFHFGSLEFVTDKLGALRLHEEEAAPVAAEEPVPPPKSHKLRRRRSVHWRIRKRWPSQPTRAVLRHIALMMASNPAIEDVNLSSSLWPTSLGSSRADLRSQHPAHFRSGSRSVYATL